MKRFFILLGGAVLTLGVIWFHKYYYKTYCAFRDAPGKSHCAVCFHRGICRKRRERRNRGMD